MTCTIGIDVAQDELVLAVRPTGETGVWTNDEAGWTALIARVCPLRPVRIVLEGTGGLEYGIAAALADAHLPVVIANPGQVRAFARGLGQLAKTDAVDAALLAHFAEVVEPPIRLGADAAHRELRALVVRRRQLRNQCVAERHRATRAAAIVQPSIAQHVTFLTGMIDELTQQIAVALTLDPTMAATATLLRSAPGVGAVVAATLIAELPELGQLDAKQIAALAGVAPMTHQSGRRPATAAIRGGRRPVRTVLYLAAISAVRCSATYRAMFDRLVARHPSKKKAYLACAHKLLIHLNAMVRDGAFWHEPPLTA
jgi:transposase